MKKRIFGTIAALAAALALAACGGAQGSGAQSGGAAGSSAEQTAEAKVPSEVNIGTQQLPNDEMLAIVKDYFEEEMGTKVNILTFEAGDIRNAMMAGDIDFAMLGSSSAILGRANGMDVSLIWLHEVLGKAEQLVAREGSGITSMEDIKGKKVAAPFTSTAHYSLLKALELADIQETELTLLDMQMPDIYAAWLRGDIDAAYGWEPTLSKLLETGTSITTSEILAGEGVITANTEIVRNEFAKEYPAMVEAYLRAVDRASADFAADPEGSAALLGDYLGISAEEALAQMQGSIWLRASEQLKDAYMGTSEQKGGFLDSVLDTAAFLYDQKSLTTAPDEQSLAAFVEPKFIEAVAVG